MVLRVIGAANFLAGAINTSLGITLDSAFTLFVGILNLGGAAMAMVVDHERRMRS